MSNGSLPTELPARAQKTQRVTARSTGPRASRASGTAPAPSVLAGGAGPHSGLQEPVGPPHTVHTGPSGTLLCMSPPEGAARTRRQQ